jgi:hypothetical protein
MFSTIRWFYERIFNMTGQVYFYNMNTQGVTLTINEATDTIKLNPMSFPVLPTYGGKCDRSTNPSPYQTKEFGLSNTIECRLDSGVSYTINPTLDLSASHANEDIVMVVLYNSMTMVLSNGTSVIWEPKKY